MSQITAKFAQYKMQKITDEITAFDAVSTLGQARYFLSETELNNAEFPPNVYDLAIPQFCRLSDHAYKKARALISGSKIYENDAIDLIQLVHRIHCAWAELIEPTTPLQNYNETLNPARLALDKLANLLEKRKAKQIFALAQPWISEIKSLYPKDADLQNWWYLTKFTVQPPL
jgi:hypothetical protein